MEDRLQKLVRLVDMGSFTAAARDLHVSQPALSVAIAKLERELKTPLIVRGVRPLALTPAGRLAYDTGRDILTKNANLKMRLAELTHQELSVSIGMIDSVASALLTSTHVVDDLERQAVVSLVVDNSRNLLQALAAGSLDVVFVVRQRMYDGSLHVVNAAAEPLVVVGVPTNESIKSHTLHHFISYDQASTTHQLIMENLAVAQITAEPTFYSTSPEVMLRLVLQGRGVAALPYLLVREYIRLGELMVLGQPPLQIARPIQAVQRRDTVLASPLTRIVSEVTDLLQDLSIEAADRFAV
jgi:DNA-binding transcriptional LysR family regulator